jgi:predicted nucleic acid-binding protein
MSKSIKKIAIDSNVLTYLLNASDPSYDPDADKSLLRKDKISILRVFLYQSELLYLLPTVETEFMRISEINVRKKHQIMAIVNFNDVLRLDNTKIRSLKKIFKKFHTKENDCQILAEAEVAGMSKLLTSDKTFIKKLKSQTNIDILTPSDYWRSLGFPHRKPPARMPHNSNPLINKTWWKW